jgi:1,4-dihydroxy-2-naphthoate octaprenyltransferase
MMKNPKNLWLVWFLQIRGPFLLLAVVLVFVGISVARYQGYSNLFHGILLYLGVIQAHISVNLFNELSDYKTGIDQMTRSTPFSGGSGMMQARLTRYPTVERIAYAGLFLAFLIGLYFCFKITWWIFPFMAAGGFAIRFYTSHLARWMIGEPVAGVMLGSFVVMGVVLALTGKLTFSTVIISIPPGLLTLQLLFLNEFPDAHADESGGRHHWVIHFSKKTCRVIYISILIAIYLILFLLPLFTSAPRLCRIALITVPLACVAAVQVYTYHESPRKLVPALGLNVTIVLVTDFLLGLGFWLASN